MTISGGIFSLFYKSIKQKFTFTQIFIIAHGVFGLGYIVIALFPTVIPIFIGLFISGIGLGLFVPNFTVWLTTETPENIRGRALSGLTSFLFLGQFLSPFVSQPLLQLVSFTDLFLLAGLGMLLISSIFAIFEIFKK
jgi:dipeptide/tripeptide permease